MKRAAPERTCVGCRRTRPKSELIRLARRADGTVARAPHAAGRGAYVCDDPACIERVLKGGRLAQAFRKPCDAHALVTGTEAILWR